MNASNRARFAALALVLMWVTTPCLSGEDRTRSDAVRQPVVEAASSNDARQTFVGSVLLTWSALALLAIALARLLSRQSRQLDIRWSGLKSPKGRSDGLAFACADGAPERESTLLHADAVQLLLPAVVTLRLDGTIAAWNRGAEKLF